MNLELNQEPEVGTPFYLFLDGLTRTRNDFSLRFRGDLTDNEFIAILIEAIKILASETIEEIDMKYLEKVIKELRK